MTVTIMDGRGNFSTTKRDEANAQKIPSFRTCPICKFIKKETQFHNEVYLDGVLVKICYECYARHFGHSYIYG